MVLRGTLLAASRSPLMHAAATATPITKSVVKRFVAGEGSSDAVKAAASLAGVGLHCSLDYLGEPVTNLEKATASVNAYLRLLEALNEADLTDRAEISLKLSAVGQSLAGDGEQVALDNARRICQQAANLGTVVTIDMEDHTSTDATLATVAALRADFPGTGAVLQAHLKRTGGDCRDLAGPGSRVRLVKGAYAEPSTVAFQSSQDIDLAYVRCMKILMAGQGLPMIATHDARLIEIAGAIGVRTGRERGSYEYQMLFGVRPDEQKRLAAVGEKVRVYVPFGSQWYPYLIRRMAEKPANLGLFLRALTSRN